MYNFKQNRNNNATSIFYVTHVRLKVKTEIKIGLPLSKFGLQIKPLTQLRNTDEMVSNISFETEKRKEITRLKAYSFL